jgi:hypothetical protein
VLGGCLLVVGRGALEGRGEGLVQEGTQLDCKFKWGTSCVVEFIATLHHRAIRVVKFVS